jgi:CelD/BcsL family acetyltransferase involved in cellulose biosynthesis
MASTSAILEPQTVEKDRSAPSNITVRMLDPLRDAEWDRLVISHPDYTFFHGAAWAKVLASTYAHSPVYLYFARQSEPVALVPLMEINSRLTGRRGVCLPFTDLCPPLVFAEESEQILAGISRLACERGWRYFELRGGRKMLPPSIPAAREFYGHNLALSHSANELLVRFASPVRRAIRKAEKSGLAAEVSTTWEAVLEFYRLHIRTRRRHGVPPQPLSFFRSIHKHVIEPGAGFVVLGTSAGKCVAAAVFLRFGKRAIYKFGASDDAFQGYRGNNLVMWEGIKSLKQHGVESLHFGRTDISNDGLRRFKSGWGTEEETIEYFEFDTGKEAWKARAGDGTTFYNKVFRKLPLVLNRIAGSIIYPHLH